MSEQALHYSSNAADNSHTVIDLTNDTDEAMPRRRISRSRGESQRPQLLTSNNSTSMEDFVDLTVDREQEDGNEIIVTGQRRLVLRRSLSRPGPRSSFNPNSRSTLRSNSPSLFLPSGPVMPVLSSGYRFTAVRNGNGGLAVDLTRLEQMLPPIEDIPTFLQLSSLQPMTSHMEFGRAPYSRRPNYVPPSAARENFTRSPTSSDIIVCPSCDEELVHHKGEPMVKKVTKSLSKKDRAEHPFWVIKECGHVCFPDSITISFF